MTSRLIALRYKNKAALGAHGKSSAFKAFQKALADEDLVGGPLQLKIVKSGMYCWDFLLFLCVCSSTREH